MNQQMNRRDFIKASAMTGALSVLPVQFCGCSPGNHADFLSVPAEYDIFFKFKAPRKILRFESFRLGQSFPNADPQKLWLMRSILTIFQGLINRVQPRIHLEHSKGAVDWLSIYQKDGHDFQIENVSDFNALISRFAGELDGYIVIDPNMLHGLNVAQTLASLENLMVITPDMEALIAKTGLKKKEDLRGRWQGRVPAYDWAFENLFSKCSKHIVGDCCVDFPYAPSGGSFLIRDFLVANKAFTVDLSAAYRQRKEYRLLDKIYAQMELPGGVWGWHDSRDHEHWAVERASRKGLYTICATAANFSVHGAIIPNDKSLPKQKESPRKSRVAEKDKVYIAFMMTDGDSLWAMESLQKGKWGPNQQKDFAMSFGFLPLLADIAPAMYKHYVKTQQPYDCMVCGPSGAGYTYTHLHPDPHRFLRYSKFYMQRCDLNVVHITNWNDYTNWQEVDVPWFNPILFKELDNCIGYVRGMGESAFEPNYNFKDKPFVTCGEGLHRNDKDDVATIENFIKANPNRPLFVFVLINVAVTLERIRRITTHLQQYKIEYVRMDDFMHLVKDAYKQGLITEVLYPNRKGNQAILSEEAPGEWMGTKAGIERLIPVLNANSESEGLARMNTKEAGLALGQRMTQEDGADVLAFELCKSMFSLVKNVLNYKGIYVNKRMESIERFKGMFPKWAGMAALPKLVNIWENWDKLTIQWEDIVSTGREFLVVYQAAARLFSSK